MKKQPWLPKKPKQKRKYPECRGTGLVSAFAFSGSVDVKCYKCGGKGFQ